MQLTPEQKAKIGKLATGIVTGAERLPDGTLIKLKNFKPSKMEYIGENDAGIIIGSAYDPVPTGSKWIYHTFFISESGEQRFSFFRDDEIEPADWQL